LRPNVYDDFVRSALPVDDYIPAIRDGLRAHRAVVVVALLLMTVAVVASLVPAVRATRLDPVTTLRRGG